MRGNGALSAALPSSGSQTQDHRAKTAEASNMDFQGQKLAEQLCLYIICIAGLVAFLFGWLEGSFALMMKVCSLLTAALCLVGSQDHLNSFHVQLQVYGSGVAVAMVACVPDWPWYNRHPLKWLPSAPKQSSPVAVATSKQKKIR